MAQHHSLLKTIASVLVPVHRDGLKFVAAGALASVLFFWLWSPLGWIALVLTAFCAYFFRDPARVSPLRPGLILSPADGRISAIAEVVPPDELELGPEPRVRVSVFLSVLDVHIVRAPVSGHIVHEVYKHGRFLNAELDKASEENERHGIAIASPSGARIGCVLIAGLVARRIVTFRGQGHTVQAGERIGLIRFGSRADIYLPPGRSVLVAVGQRAIAGETVLADLTSEEPARDTRLD